MAVPGCSLMEVLLLDIYPYDYDLKVRGTPQHIIYIECDLWEDSDTIVRSLPVVATVVVDRKLLPPKSLSPAPARGCYRSWARSVSTSSPSVPVCGCYHCMGTGCGIVVGRIGKRIAI